jgi:D-sedoheptulose 7-phosphate isomerase
MKSFAKLISDKITESITVKTKLMSQCAADIEICGNNLAKVLNRGNKVLFCGNGGSAADSQHIAAELVVRLRSGVERPGIKAIALTVDSSILTACSNDYGFEEVYARQIDALGEKGDALVAISTSGTSENIIKAVQKAKDKKMEVYGLLGNKGGDLYKKCRNSVIVPSDDTARIQESHILVGHLWCEIIEETLFPELFEKD